MPFHLQLLLLQCLYFRLCMMTIYYTAANVWASLVMTFPYRSYHFALVPSLTLLLLNSVKADAEMLVASLGPACFNIANALGAFLGGIPIEKKVMDTLLPVLVGATMAAAGNCNISAISKEK